MGSSSFVCPSIVCSRCLHPSRLRKRQERAAHILILPHSFSQCTTTYMHSFRRLSASVHDGEPSLLPIAPPPPFRPPESGRPQPGPLPEPLVGLNQAYREALLLSELWQGAGVGPHPPLLQMQTSPAGVRGLAVRSGAGVKAGELLLSVPMAAVLSVPKELGEGRGRAETGGVLRDAACRLAVKLLVELQRPESTWRYYAHLLPAQYESVGDWTPSELSELQGEAVVRAALAATEEWHAQAGRIRAAATAHTSALPPPLNSAQGNNPSSPPLDSAQGNSRSPPVPATCPPDPPLTPHPSSMTPQNGGARATHETNSPEDPVPISPPPPPSGPLWLPPFSPAAALWALRTVLTRSFSATLEGAPLQCLVPVADMLNHAPATLLSRRAAKETGWPFRANPSPVWPRSHSAPDLGFAQWRIHDPQGTPPGAACFQVFASTHLAAGQEATICYGPYTSAELLIFYGFVPGTNPADRVALYDCLQDALDDVDAPVKLARQKEELLFTVMGGARRFFSDAEGAAPQLLEFLYVLHAQDAAELACLEGEWHRSASLSSAHISRPTRAAAARQVVQRCSAPLAQHPTSLEEDERLWEELEAGEEESRGCDSGKLRVALRLRMLRKEILTRMRTRYAALAGVT